MKRLFSATPAAKKTHIKQCTFYLSIHDRINILLNLVTTTGATFPSINKRTAGAIDPTPTEAFSVAYIFSSTMAKEHKEMLFAYVK